MRADHVDSPTAWRTVPLWSLLHRVKDVGHPADEMLSVYRDHGVVRKESPSDNFNKTAENRNIYQLVDDGWLIVNRMKAWQGSLGISPYRGIVSGHYICFQPEHREHSWFLNYLLRSDVYTAELQRRSRGVRPNQIEIDNDRLRVLPVLLPPLAEQRQITDFLDRETARIDSLVDKKRRLIDLLEEKRTALITHAVTKGLDSTAPMKNSGLDWAARVPEHWDIRKIGHLVKAPSLDLLSGLGDRATRAPGSGRRPSALG